VSGPSRRPSGARRRELGQNFLVDANLLAVIERLAELSEEDVVLEVGGGQGVLSRRLAARVAALHVIEVDRSLEGPLRAALSPYPSARLWLADATTLPLAQLAPAPGKVVANLPYSVAATVILRTIELASITRWLVMVQREVGERFAAAPGSTAYGIPSVLAQLACEVRVLRAVPRTVFRPVPNVDSVLLELRRVRPAPSAATAELVRRAFAHRRKPLAGSLALAAGAPPDVRERARAALQTLGLPADARAERLEPEQFRALAEALWG